MMDLLFLHYVALTVFSVPYRSPIESIIPGFLYYAILAAFSVVVGAVCVEWIRLIFKARESKKHLPSVPMQEDSTNPKISVIVPAKNEEEYIGRCIRTLLAQNYSNYEIILINDYSDDITWDIMNCFAKKHDNIIVHSTKKPDGWMGKTWACSEGVKRASGDILLFTDADTSHDTHALSRTISYMESENLDCLTLTQKLDIPEMWVRATLPVITSFKLVYPDGIIRYSSKAVNDPKNSMGGVNGAFLMMKKSVYEDVGGFEKIKHYIVEDWAMGRNIKNAKYKLRLANGGDILSALWARDLPTLNNVLSRLMLPFVKNNKAKGIFAGFILLFLLFLPYPITAISLGLHLIYQDIFSLVLLATSATASLLHMISYGMQAKMSGISLKKIFLAPLGGFVASTGFLDGLRTKSTMWRGRNITPEDITTGTS